MNKVAVLVDSGSKIKQGEFEEMGIFVAPLSITYVGETYLDGIDINSDQLYKNMQETQELASTSQPSTGEIIKVIEKIKAQGYTEILGISLGSGLSSTLQGFNIAAEMEDIKITIVDTHSSSNNHRYLAYVAATLLADNFEVVDLVQILEELVARSQTVISVPNLKHLSESGRITPAIAKIAGLLKIVPIMFLNHDLGGKIDSYARVRTMRKAINKCVDFIIEEGKVNNEDYLISVQHVLAEDEAIQLKEEIIKRIGQVKNISISPLPAVVGAYMGIGGIVIQSIPLYNGIKIK